MKTKILLFSVCFALLGIFAGFTQDIIPNGSFEAWSTNPVNPDNWTNPLSILSLENVTPSNDAQSGSHSAEFKIIFNQFTSTNIPAAIFSDSIPLTAKQTALKGFIKGTLAGTDMFSISIILFRNDSAIASGNFSTADSYASWTGFSVPISYTYDKTPDMALIDILVGNQSNPDTETDILVDNLYFEGSSGTNEQVLTDNVSLYPNPASNDINVRFTLPEPDQIRFSMVSAQGTVTPVSGKQIFSAGENKLAISTAQFASGIYILQGVGDRYLITKRMIVSR